VCTDNDKEKSESAHFLTEAADIVNIHMDYNTGKLLIKDYPRTLIIKDYKKDN